MKMTYRIQFEKEQIIANALVGAGFAEFDPSEYNTVYIFTNDAAKIFEHALDSRNPQPN